MRYPSTAVIREVGPRDGFQNEAPIPVDLKLKIVDALCAAGIKRIEVTSFMNPRIVPQTADAAELMRRLDRRPGVEFEALIATPKNALLALNAGINRLSVAIATTDAFNVSNFRRTKAESFANFEECALLAHQKDVPITGIIGGSTGDPFIGRVATEEVLKMADEFVQRGADELFIGDSMGFADPKLMADLVRVVRQRYPKVPLGAHIHNTRGMGLANVLGCLDEGITLFDASVAGLGGCPFGPLAAGNICTEDLVHMLHGMGIQTGIDLDAMLEASRITEQVFGKTLPGHVLHQGKSFTPHSIPTDVQQHLSKLQ